VRGETIDYIAPGTLSVPRHYWALGPAPQGESSPAGGGGRGREAQGLRALRDEVLNLFGFIPLGFFLALIWRRLSVAWVVALCAAVSAATEIGQWFLPARDPQLIDLALNTLGGVLGAVLGRGAGFLLARPRPGILA
jgi:VanZ family protein